MQDYDNFRDTLTDREAITLLEQISRSWLPDYNFTGTENDFEKYCLHKAIDRAIDALEERGKECAEKYFSKPNGKTGVSCRKRNGG